MAPSGSQGVARPSSLAAPTRTLPVADSTRRALARGNNEPSTRPAEVSLCTASVREADTSAPKRTITTKR
jgi:hypothetical protein